ncbi:hypothetical protein RJ639_047791 [Escallonia herrerae]|uniref:Uncharacterized protein n=1 Tax=Escallonia herrerae TaxID=1293975 RepID=A0AA89AYH3_9ASTE|nr:hypothetical protein RJ639_047791 [Escallonia herrerae]
MYASSILIFMISKNLTVSVPMSSSWQIPTGVTELRKKQDGDLLKEQPMSVPNTNILTEKGSAPFSLSTPAVNTGGRDATALRTSAVQGSSSALDMIKKKLQDSGDPVTSAQVPGPSGAVASDLNGSRAVEGGVKGPQIDNSKDKLKNVNIDGNLSDSSSDSEDADSRPTKEECIIQFKNSCVSKVWCSSFTCNVVILVKE